MQIKSINILIYRFRTNITLDHKYMQNNSQPVFRYGEDQLTIGRALHLARGIEKGILTAETRDRIDKNRKTVERIVHKKKIVYGINTGFGPLCTTLIGEEDTRKLQ